MRTTSFSLLLITGMVCLLTLVNTPQVNASSPSIHNKAAVVRVLDKITARVEEVEISIDRPVVFGTLTITIKSCLSTPPEAKPEATAFIVIEELKPGANSIPVFQGWMFASSPAISSLEHPVYDLWITGCRHPQM